MIDRYELTAKLTPVLLEAFREGYAVVAIEDSVEDAIAIAKAQYHRETAEAKRKKEEDAASDRDKMKKLLLASMKALRSIDDDPAAKFITDEYLDNILTDDVIDFASEISKAISNASQTGTVAENISSNISYAVRDCDSYIIGEWLKHQKW